MSPRADVPAIAVAGVLLLDKPEGITSNRALQRVRRVFAGARAGHCGTLDPAASGLLPICLGVATRIASHLTGSRKRYRATVKLGVETDSDDRDGRILAEYRGPLPGEDEVTAALAAFEGRIHQVPPAFSALKQGGEPLYRKARRGETPSPPAREVEVHRLVLLGRPCADRLELEIDCGPGFYVRALARDLGRRLGCGAHLASLRRTAVGRFGIEKAVTLDCLEALAAEHGPPLHLLLAITDALPDLPRVVLGRDEARGLLEGRAPASAWSGASAEALAVDQQGRVLALLERGDGRPRIRRLLSAPTPPECGRALSASDADR